MIDHIEKAVLGERRRFEIFVRRRAAKRDRIGELELFHIGFVDTVERRIPLGIVGAVVHQPVAGLRVGKPGRRDLSRSCRGKRQQSGAEKRDKSQEIRMPQTHGDLPFDSVSAILPHHALKMNGRGLLDVCRFVRRVSRLRAAGRASFWGDTPRRNGISSAPSKIGSFFIKPLGSSITQALSTMGVRCPSDTIINGDTHTPLRPGSQPVPPPDDDAATDGTPGRWPWRRP